MTAAAAAGGAAPCCCCWSEAGGTGGAGTANGCVCACCCCCLSAAVAGDDPVTAGDAPPAFCPSLKRSFLPVAAVPVWKETTPAVFSNTGLKDVHNTLRSKPLDTCVHKRKQQSAQQQAARLILLAGEGQAGRAQHTRSAPLWPTHPHATPCPAQPRGNLRV